MKNQLRSRRRHNSKAGRPQVHTVQPPKRAKDRIHRWGSRGLMAATAIRYGLRALPIREKCGLLDVAAIFLSEAEAEQVEITLRALRAAEEAENLLIEMLETAPGK